MTILRWLGQSPTIAAVLLVAGLWLVLSNTGGQSAFYNWSKTAGTNATADSSINWSEGQSPSSINDSARAMMARTAEYRDDISGSSATAGTSTAYTLTTNQAFSSLALMDKARVCFSVHATNGGTSTLNVDSLGAKPLRTAPSADIASGVLILGSPYCAVYNNGDGAFYLNSFYSNPYTVPLGAMMPYTASTAPNSNFVLPFGQAISRTTYATYFSLVGTTYGVGDGATTFNVVDMRGRVAAAQDNMGGVAANRITTVTTDTGIIVGATVGSVGGSQAHAVTTTEMPPHNHTITDPGHSHGTSQSPGNAIVGNNANAAVQGGFAATVPAGATSLSLSVNSASTGITQTNSAGIGNAMALLPPMVITTYIMRIL